MFLRSCCLVEHHSRVLPDAGTEFAEKSAEINGTPTIAHSLILHSLHVHFRITID